MKLKIFLIALVLIFIFGITTIAFGMTDQEKQALIAQIQQQIASLQAQINQILTQQQGTQNWCHTFNNNLGHADSGTDEVVNLHLALQQQNISYSPDGVNAYSTGTSDAIKQFQLKYGIIPQSGYVGPKTRTQLNVLYGCVITPTSQCTIDDDCPQPNCSGAANCIGSVNRCIGGLCVLSSLTCTSSWQVGTWSACTNGQQSRTVTDANSCGITTDKPITNQSCTVSCTPSWQLGPWGVCVNGRQTRTVTDLSGCGTEATEPIGSQSCIVACTPNWQTGAWGTCVNGQKTRMVTDSNNCGVITNKPATAQFCTATCTPNWQAGPWGICSNGQQSRTVTDSNNCGVTTNKPATTQSCTYGSVVCADSDGGRNYYVKGTVTTNAPGRTSPVYDECMIERALVINLETSKDYQKASSCSGNSCYLFEYYCKGTVIVPDTDFVCPNGCLGGACIGPAPLCTPLWQVGVWSPCTNSGTQTRIVTDSNNCGVTTNKPATTQSCRSLCGEYWVAGDWGPCVNNQQTRTVTDSHNCGTTTNKPTTTRYCVPGYTPTFVWTSVLEQENQGVSCNCIDAKCTKGISGSTYKNGNFSNYYYANQCVITSYGNPPGYTHYYKVFSCHGKDPGYQVFELLDNCIP